MEKPIWFNVKHDNAAITIKTYRGEYRNLMFLLRDQLLIDGFGECGGMGRCGTCLVNATELKGDSNNKERNEPVTLAKMGIDLSTIRLSCQLLINDELTGANIEIIEDY